MEVRAKVSLRPPGRLLENRQGRVNGAKAWVFKKRYITLENAVFHSTVMVTQFAERGDSRMVITSGDCW